MKQKELSEIFGVIGLIGATLVAIKQLRLSSSVATNLPVLSGGAEIAAGFALAHAAWSASDLPKEELLVPLAIIESKGERKLLRFEATTQEEAVARGQEEMKKITGTVDAWAFARDGLIRRDGHKIDCILVEFWGPGMPSPAAVVQQYEPFSSGRFRLVGDPWVIVSGLQQTPEQAAGVLAKVREGIKSHSKVAALWDAWK
jgi:hypothetical protein